MFPRFRYILPLSILISTIGLTACASIAGTAATATSTLPSATPLPPTPTPPPLAATVNGEWLTEEEFLAEVERYRTDQRSLGNEVTVDDATKTVLDDMIAQIILAQAARTEGFELSEEDLDVRIEALASSIGGTDALVAWQSEHGYTDETFRVALKRAAEAAWMRDKIITAVPGTAEQVHAQQILLYNEVDARKVADQLNAGADFADLAVLYDPHAGGELGWFPRGYLLEPELEEIAFSLQAGQVSDVIETEVGFHILLVLEHDLHHQLSPEAYLVMQENALRDWVAQKRAEVDIVLAP